MAILGLNDFFKVFFFREGMVVQCTSSLKKHKKNLFLIYLGFSKINTEPKVNIHSEIL